MKISEKQKKIIEKTLRLFEHNPPIIWDRFFYDTQRKELSIYGWVHRLTDSYKDFVQLVFVFGWFGKIRIEFSGTSSAKYSEVISKKLFGDKSLHFPCQRVENHFNIPNSIKLKG